MRPGYDNLTLTSKRERHIRITSKGQVTIPIEIRNKAGLVPNTDVEFELDGLAVRIFPSKQRETSRGSRLVARLRGAGDGTMTTDEIMALTRGDD